MLPLGHHFFCKKLLFRQDVLTNNYLITWLYFIFFRLVYVITSPSTVYVSSVLVVWISQRAKETCQQLNYKILFLVTELAKISLKSMAKESSSKISISISHSKSLIAAITCFGLFIVFDIRNCP